MTLKSRYTILSKIADGGTAEIFLATQHGAHGFEKPVVLKRIFPAFYADPQFRNMLVDEAHIAMSLSHSNIVQVLDLGEDEGQYVLALELVDGWTLDAIFRRARAVNTAIPPALALYLTAEICRALAYAHSKTGSGGKPLGIIHRDISPHNVLLSEQGEVKLTDFGIAKAHNRRDSSLGNIIKGKIAYMSPEQAAGAPLDARSDLFSVGTMLYVMICRRYPFDAPTDLEVLLLVKNGECAPPESARPGLNPEIYRVLKRAMGKAPADRYQRAEEMLVDVEQVMRVAFRAVGQTELKRWLQDLSVRDGILPLLRGLAEPTNPPGGRAPRDSQPHRVVGTPPPVPPGTLPPRRTSLPTPAGLRSTGGSGPTALRPPPPPAALVVGRKTVPTPPPGSLRTTASHAAANPPPVSESPKAAQEPSPKSVAPKPEDAPIEGQSTPAGVRDVDTKAQVELLAEAPGELLEAPIEPPGEAAPEEIGEAAPLASPETGSKRESEAESEASTARAPEATAERELETAPETATEEISPTTTDGAAPLHSPPRSSSSVTEAVLAAAGRALAPHPPPPGASPLPPAPPFPDLSSQSVPTPAAPSPAEESHQPRRRRGAIGVALGLAGLAVLFLVLKGLSGGHKQREKEQSTTVRTIQTTAAPDSSVTAVAEIVPLPPTSAKGGSVATEDAPVTTENARGGARSPTAPPLTQEVPRPAGAPDPSETKGSPALAPVAENATDTTPDGQRPEPVDDEEPSTEAGARPRGPRPRVEVLIKSIPPGALVETAHHSFGPTPLTVRLKVGGNYTFTLTTEGRRPLVKRIHVSGEPDQEVTVMLRRATTASAPPTTQGANQPPQPAKARDPSWLQRMFSR